MSMIVRVTQRGTNRTIDAGGDPQAQVASFGSIKRVECSSKLSTGFGGWDTAEITVVPNGAWVGGLFRPGDPVVLDGRTHWEGIYSETEYRDDETVVLHCRGNGHALFDYVCEVFQSVEGDTDTSYPTRNPDDGLARALAYGMPISTYFGDVPALLAGSAAGAVDISALDVPARSWGDVFSEAVSDGQQFWACWGPVLVIFDPMDTAPVWALDAKAGFVGVADTAYYTDVHVLFLKTGTGALDDHAIAAATDGAGVELFGRRMRPAIDYRPVIVGDEVAAQQVAATLLQKVKGRHTLSGSITVTGPDSGLTTINGGRVPLGFVRAGQRVQVKDARTTAGAFMPDGDASFVIGEARFTWEEDGEESLSLSAMDPAPRDLDQILAPPAAEGGTPEPPEETP